MSEEKLTKRLQSEVNKVLQENLPATAAGLVGDRLKQADALEKENAELRDKVEEQHARIEELVHLANKEKALADKEESIRAQYDDLELQRKALDERENQLDKNQQIFELQTKLESQQAMTAHTTMINENLTKNVEYRRYRMEQHNRAVADQYGGTMTHTDTKDISEEDKVRLEGEI